MEAGDGQPPTGSQQAAATTGSEPALVEQTPEQQIAGLRAWIAQVERKLGIRSLAGGVAVVLALAAGILGVVLATSAKDESATKVEVKSLSERVTANTQQATQAAQNDLASLSDRLDALEGRVSTIASGQRTSDSELQVAQDDIDELRGQISDLQSSIDAARQANQANLGNAGNP